ncbi:MAG: hypothetical protein LC792_10525 [Actinobacteria bacterium]|nr:hypothetical protein [Actinomycetota bacterium]
MRELSDDEMFRCADCATEVEYWDAVRLVVTDDAVVPLCGRCWHVRQLARLN